MKTKHWIASGLLTVLLAGANLSYAHGDGDWQGRDGGKPMHHMDCGQRLPEAKRKLLHETMKKMFEKDKALIGQMHQLHRQLHAVLAAETFDSKAYMSLNEKIERLHARLHKDRAEAFASIAGQFTPQERERLARIHGRHHHHHGGHHGWRHAGGQGTPNGYEQWQSHHDQEWQARPAEDSMPAAPVDPRAYPPYPSR